MPETQATSGSRCRSTGPTIAEGTAHFSIADGPLALRVQMNDAPYGMKLEKVYQISTIVDCDAASHNLVMGVGNAGDALLEWQ